MLRVFHAQCMHSIYYVDGIPDFLTHTCLSQLFSSTLTAQLGHFTSQGKRGRETQSCRGSVCQTGKLNHGCLLPSGALFGESSSLFQEVGALLAGYPLPSSRSSHSHRHVVRRLLLPLAISCILRNSAFNTLVDRRKFACARARVICLLTTAKIHFRTEPTVQ